MLHRLIALAALFFVLPAQAQIVGAAVRVNGAEISILRLERYFDEYVKDKGRNISKMINPKVYKKLKREALDKLIDRELLGQAAKEQGVSVGDTEVQAAVDDLIAQAKNRDAYLRRLDRSGFDEKSYFEYVRQDLAIHRCLEKTVPLPQLTFEELNSYYKDNPKQFSRPETVRGTSPQGMIRVHTRSDENGISLRIDNPGSLPAGFDFDDRQGLGNGLQLMAALLNPPHTDLSLRQVTPQTVSATLHLTPPPIRPQHNLRHVP